MRKQSTIGVYTSEIFSSGKNVIHGFSTRALGDMRHVPPRHVLKEALGLSSYRLVGASQEHGNVVHVVTDADYSKTVEGVDGLVFRQKGVGTGVALGIITADCVPLLFADTQAGVIAAVHAGWKGTRDHIAQHVIQSMVDLGATVGAIQVAFGPYIGPCCYTVPESRAVEFRQQFRSKAVAVQRNAQWFLDLGLANMETLLEAGVSRDHIDHQLLCTFEHTQQLYSYRKEQKDTYGEQMAIIALSR